MDLTQPLVSTKKRGRVCKPAFWSVFAVTLFFWMAFAGPKHLRYPNAKEERISEKRLAHGWKNQDWSPTNVQRGQKQTAHAFQTSTGRKQHHNGGQSEQDEAATDVDNLDMMLRDLSSELLDVRTEVQSAETNEASNTPHKSGRQRKNRWQVHWKSDIDESPSGDSRKETMQHRRQQERGVEDSTAITSRQSARMRMRRRKEADLSPSSSKQTRIENLKRKLFRYKKQLEREERGLDPSSGRIRRNQRRQHVDMRASSADSEERGESLFSNPSKGRTYHYGQHYLPSGPAPMQLQSDLKMPTDTSGGSGHDRLATPKPDLKGGEFKFTDGAGPGPGESGGPKEGYTFVEDVTSHQGHIKKLTKDRTGMKLLGGDVWKPGWGWVDSESELAKDPRYKQTGWDSLDSSLKMPWLGDGWRMGWGWHTQGEDGQYPYGRLLRRELSKSMHQ